jgi:hypothetical protein
VALSSSTQLLFGFGSLDHHYAEYLSILASIAAGLAWFKVPGRGSAIALGTTFGLALAIHNALFILQVPLLVTAILHWLQDKRAPLRHALTFAGTLLAASLAVLLPSQPFQEGRFEFYLLSWFHLYVVCGTALVVVLLSWLQPTRRNIGVLAAFAALALAPLLNQIAYARSFVAGSLGMLDQILEMRSPLQMVRDGDFGPLTGFYSALFFLAPVTFGLCAIKLWRERTSYRLLFWIWCIFGLTLMMTQVRMHYFGTFALFLPWLVLAQEIGANQPERHRQALLVTSLLLVLAYAPVIRHELVAPGPVAGERWFKPLYPIFSPLHAACAKDPGIVLADINAGHYIRYFTDCSVIANPFLLTAQHFHKADQVDQLFSLPAEQLPKQAPFVKYVLARAGDIKAKGADEFDYNFYGRLAPGLSRTLLLGSAQSIPPEFKLLYEVTMFMRVPGGGTREVPYAKLYKIVPPAAVAPTHVGE